MRFTFVILLFCCLGADAQMIIKAHPNYVPFASANLLLDQYSGSAAAYSLRKLRTAYTGSAIRVRRSNDNSEQDIGFTSSRDLDTASLKTFVGANSGFVTTWYDQSGNARNATQTTAANQPRIVNAGVIDRELNLPMIRFDGSNDFLSESTLHNLFINKKPILSLFTVTKTRTATSGRTIFRIGNTANAGEHIRLEITATAYFIAVRNTTGAGASSATATTTYNTTDNYLLSLIIDNNNINFWQNNIQGVTNVAQNTTMSSGLNQTQICQWFPSGSVRAGNYHEMVIYDTDQTSNRTGIETNINSYYEIY
jgi:hypothetical protein